MRTITLYLYVFVGGLAASHLVFYYPQMPEKMAVHFTGGGVADGWSAKGIFFIINAVMIALSLLIFAFFPWLAEKRRMKKFSVPNRVYWLAPENIDEFYHLLREKMAWFGITNIIFGTAVSHLVFEANSIPHPTLDNSIFSVLIGAYFLFVIIWLILFFRRLLRPETG